MATAPRQIVLEDGTQIRQGSFVGVRNPYDATDIYYSVTRELTPDMTLVVTRVSSWSVLVRLDNSYSFWVPRSNLEGRAADGSGKTYRPLGTKPEGDEYLDPRDPRLDWFWDDVYKYAERSRYCGEFDSILKALKLPARPQEFRVNRNLDNGLSINAVIRARSAEEAEAELGRRISALNQPKEEVAAS